jgi:hypothetical protein
MVLIDNRAAPRSGRDSRFGERNRLDKTGTLTKNEMTVGVVVTASGR